MIKHQVEIRGGRLFPKNDSLFRREISRYEGKRVDVTVKLHREASSDPQRKYYFKVIIGTVCEHFGYGLEDKDRVHYALKEKFLGERQANGLVIVPSYRKLTTAQAEEYHENVRRWMLTEFNCPILKPNEVEIEEFELN